MKINNILKLILIILIFPNKFSFAQAELLSFSGSITSTSNGIYTIHFNWTTASLTNVYYFAIVVVDHNCNNSYEANGPRIYPVNHNATHNQNWFVDISAPANQARKYKLKIYLLDGNENILGACLQIPNPSSDYDHFVTLEEWPCEGGLWTKVFEDNFEGNQLDMSKWELPYQGVIRDFNFDNIKYWTANTGTTPSITLSHNIEVSYNSTINSGTLKLIARKEVPAISGTYVTSWSPLTYGTSSFNYSSAEMWSKQSFGRGKYEIRCKIPKGWGFWPAFWIYGTPIGVYNEIDVFEFWNPSSSSNLSKIHHMTVHYNGDMSADDYTGPDYSQSFHTFTVIWDFDKILWYVDNNVKRTYIHYYDDSGAEDACPLEAFHSYYANPLFPVNSMQIIAGFGIQHNNGNDPNVTTPFPSTYEIDYIKYSKRMACNSTLNQCNYHMNNAYNSVELANNITLGNNDNCNAYVGNNESLSLIASNEITLKPGFHAHYGSNFTAYIEECGAQLPPPINDNQNTNSGSSNAENYYRSDSTKNDYGFDDSFLLYPNPSDGLIYFKTLNNLLMKYSISIFSSLGEKVFTREINDAGVTAIDISHLAKGFYIINIYSEGQLCAKKFSIN